MKTKMIIALALLALSTGADADAPFNIGASLKGTCNIGWDSKYGYGICQGYLVAIVDVGHGTHFCLPDHVDRNDLRTVFRGYAAAASAAELNKLAPAVVINAFKQAWPCGD